MKQQAIATIRFSPKLFKELIQFEVEINSLPIGD